MLKITITTIILLTFIISGKTQQAFYKHLEGKVGDNISVIHDIVVTGEKLGGYYYYFFNDNIGDDTWVHYGKSMPLTGKAGPDYAFEFSEYETEVKGTYFKGEIKNGIVKGTWTNEEGNKQLPFEATETYPLGTMAFHVIYLEDQSLLTGKANSPAADIHLSLLLPVGYPDPNVADSVTAFIYQDFFEKESPVVDPSTLLVKARDQYFKNYKASNNGIYQEGATSFDWRKIQEIRIMHNEHDILSYENYTYGFTGGAHGLSVSKFSVIDMKAGSKVTLDEIFRADYQNDLRDIINSAVRKKYNLDLNQSLVDAGFYQPFIDAGTNFYLTKDGIGFFYNQYEIAPFALGPINIFINYKEVKRILHPESPVYRLINSKYDNKEIEIAVSGDKAFMPE